MEETFRKVMGVTTTAVGYMGGETEKPTYEDVCSECTGHAEVVNMEFDPSVVSYGQLLDIFWDNHDPTTLDRQGPDVGTRYRSVVFFHTPEQKEAAVRSRESQDGSGRFRRPIVTQIVPAATFWRAEEYHQRYLRKKWLDSCRV